MITAPAAGISCPPGARVASARISTKSRNSMRRSITPLITVGACAATAARVARVGGAGEGQRDSTRGEAAVDHAADRGRRLRGDGREVGQGARGARVEVGPLAR